MASFGSVLTVVSRRLFINNVTSTNTVNSTSSETVRSFRTAFIARLLACTKRSHTPPKCGADGGEKTHYVLLTASFFGRLGSLTRLSKAFLSSFSPAVILVPLSLYAVAGVIPRLRGWLRTLHLTLDAFFYDSPYGSSAL